MQVAGILVGLQAARGIALEYMEWPVGTHLDEQQARSIIN
jgi:hypothetical protein